ncbi:MAG: tRNA (adenosine(37)-N6)-threonylcarbamoyltransferase complex transferase subunit TsaD [Chthonomonadales bacterium]
MIVLGIETSCDETSASIVRDGREILSNVIASQAQLHAKWGGVVPEVASREHMLTTIPVILEALEIAGVDWASIDGIAVTNRPGLVGALLVGVTAAKTLAYVHKRPIVGVNHLEGHLYSALLADKELEPPMVSLIVSGGHTELVHFQAPGMYSSLGRTRDDAAGECYDKCARLMGLPYPGGPEVDRLAALGNPKAIHFPRAMLSGEPGFSFSGLKTALRYHIAEHGMRDGLENIAASLQAAIVDVLVKKTMKATEMVGLQSIAVVGGVAANIGLKSAMTEACNKRGFRLAIPPIELCGDNAAMIAAAGTRRLMAGEDDGHTLNTYAHSPLVV